MPNRPATELKASAQEKILQYRLFKNPKVALAAVVGLPDPKTGEYVKAYVQLKPGEQATEEEILQFCRENMAGYKRPRSIEFRDSLPTSVVGKVLRRVLKDEELQKNKAL